MQYYLKYFSSHFVPQKVSLSIDEFTALKEAKEKLSDLLKFAENYSVLIESYRRVELAKFELELDHLLYGLPDYLDFFKARVALNGPISGYLSCSRYYLDSSKQILKSLLGDTGFEDFIKLTNNKYDTNLGYRFAEALRNYAQHNELPIETIYFNNFVESDKNIEDSHLVTSVSLYASNRKLNEDKGFKRSILKDYPEQIDLMECIRMHLEGLWEIQNHYNAIMNRLTEKYRAVFNTFISKFQNETQTNYSNFLACEENTDGEIVQNFTITAAWDDARQQALAKFGNLINLRKKYITGRIREKNLKGN